MKIAYSMAPRFPRRASIASHVGSSRLRYMTPRMKRASTGLFVGGVILIPAASIGFITGIAFAAGGGSGQTAGIAVLTVSLAGVTNTQTLVAAINHAITLATTTIRATSAASNQTGRHGFRPALPAWSAMEGLGPLGNRVRAAGFGSSLEKLLVTMRLAAAINTQPSA